MTSFGELLARQALYHSFTVHDEQLVTADSLGEIQLNDPDDIAWQSEVFTRMQRTALDPAASRAVLDGLAATRFTARMNYARLAPSCFNGLQDQGRLRYKEPISWN